MNNSELDAFEALAKNAASLRDLNELAHRITSIVAEVRRLRHVLKTCESDALTKHARIIKQALDERDAWRERAEAAESKAASLRAALDIATSMLDDAQSSDWYDDVVEDGTYRDAADWRDRAAAFVEKIVRDFGFDAARCEARCEARDPYHDGQCSKANGHEGAHESTDPGFK